MTLFWSREESGKTKGKFSMRFGGEKITIFKIIMVKISSRTRIQWLYESDGWGGSLRLFQRSLSRDANTQGRTSWSHHRELHLAFTQGWEGTWASPTARLGNAISPGSLGRTRRGAWPLWLSSCLQILEARPTTIDSTPRSFPGKDVPERSSNKWLSGASTIQRL